MDIKNGIEQTNDNDLSTIEHPKHSEQVQNELSTTQNNNTSRDDEYAIRVIYLTMMLTMSSIAVGITGSWPYMQKIDPKVSPNFLGWANFGFYFAAIIGDFMYGRWMVYRPLREPLLGSLVIMVIAGLCAAFAQGLGQYHGLIAVFMSRVLLGLARGNMTITRVAIATSTSPETRTDKMANLVIAMATGFTCGAAIHSAMVQIVEKGVYIKMLNMHLNLYTIPAWFIVLFGFLNGVLVLRYIKPKSKQQTNLTIADRSMKKKKNKFFGLACLLFMFYAVNFGVSGMETLMAPFIQHQFALTRSKSVFYAGLVFTGQGLLCAAQQFPVKVLTKRFHDRFLVAVAYCFIVLSLVLYVPLGRGHLKLSDQSTNSSMTRFSSGCPKQYGWCRKSPQISLPQFIIGATLFAIGYSSCLGLIVSLFSKLIPAYQQNTGVSIISAFANIGRLAAPVAATASYVDIGPQYTFCWMSLVCLCGLTWFFVFYKDLRIENSPNSLTVESTRKCLLQKMPLEHYSLSFVSTL